MKKIVYLLLALLLPCLVYVFLKFAGTNRFDIPVYHEDGIPEPSPCGFKFDEPYLLPVAMSTALLANKQACVLIFPEQGIAPQVIEAMLVNEIGEAFTVADASVAAADSLTLHQLRDCIFLVTPPSQTVLFDSKRQIRGYYNLGRRDEMDRLRVELKILLEKY